MRVEPDGSQTHLPIYECFPTPESIPLRMTVPFPSLDDRPIYGSLFGTGFRSNDPLQVTATVDGIPVPIPVGRPPRDAGRGTHTFGLQLIVNGVPANRVFIDLVPSN